MKYTKKIGTLILMAGLVLVGLQGCKKYPEGPLISLNSRTERVANTWKVDNYKVNGTDFTSLVTDYTETYTRDGDYSYQWGLFSGTGNWDFQNYDAEILIVGINNQATTVLTILKLEEKQFWFYYMDGTDKKEFHMIQQ
jgi:hypothetical protein